jgi:phage tail protein X
VQVLPGSSSDTLPTSSDGVCNSSNIEFEEGVGVEEEGFIARNEEAQIDIEEEELPIAIYFPDIKAEPNEEAQIDIEEEELPIDIYFPDIKAEPNEEAQIDLEEEELPIDIYFPDIKAEPNEVS